jgi:hypothetical protein
MMMLGMGHQTPSAAPGRPRWSISSVELCAAPRGLADEPHLVPVHSDRPGQLTWWWYTESIRGDEGADG